MKSDIVNRIYIELEVDEGLELFASLPEMPRSGSVIERLKTELESWLENNGAFDE